MITVKPKQRTKGYNLSALERSKHHNSIVLRLLKIGEKDIGIKAKINDVDLLVGLCSRFSEVQGGSALTNQDYWPQAYENKESESLDDRDFLSFVAYRFRYQMYPKLKILDRFPPCVQIEPVSTCNFRCVMCYQIDPSFSKKSSGHMGRMHFDLFKKVIDELEGNVEAITLASRGEPLLHPKLPEMLDYLGQKFLGLKLNTNASLLTEKMCHTLLNSGIRTLVFSVDATDRETYERIRVNGKYDEVLRNIQRFHEIKTNDYPDSPMVTKVSGVLINPQKQNEDAMIDFWKPWVDEVAFVNYNPWESAYTNAPNDVIDPCSDLWRRLFVWFDGKVNPCDYDYKTTLFAESQPNVASMSIEEIWDSERYKDLRAQHLAGERGHREPCKRCIAS